MIWTLKTFLAERHDAAEINRSVSRAAAMPFHLISGSGSPATRTWSSDSTIANEANSDKDFR